MILRRFLPRLSRLALAATGVAAILSASLAACSEDAGPTASSGTTVSVDLNEWAFSASATSAPAGLITFRAKNKGRQTHELVLFKSDLAPADLPVDEEGAVDERGAGLELIDEVEDVKPGQTKEFSADLKPGKYVMACNLIENGQRHFMNAMYGQFTVKA